MQSVREGVEDGAGRTDVRACAETGVAELAGEVSFRRESAGVWGSVLPRVRKSEKSHHLNPGTPTMSLPPSQGSSPLTSLGKHPDLNPQRTGQLRLTDALLGGRCLREGRE